MKKILNNLNNFKVMCIILIIISICLIFACAHYKNRDELYVGSAVDDNVYIKNITYFTNGDVYYINSSGAKYLGKNKDIYSYTLGYYFGDEVLFEYSVDLEKKSTIKDIINNTSEISVTEYKEKLEKFKNINIKDLVFKFSADSTKDGEFDINLESPVKFYKVSR